MKKKKVLFILINNKKMKIITLKSFFQKLKGLMFEKEKITYGVRMKTNGIHTFFMKQNIDVIIVDKNYKILYKKDNMSKNKITGCFKGMHTLELPIGSNKYFNVGDIIKIED